MIDPEKIRADAAREWQANAPQDLPPAGSLEERVRAWRHEAARATADRLVEDGDTIAVGGVTIEVVHTPGHTMDSVCLLVTDKRRSAQPWFVITGDTLFVGSVGRPDLAGREQEMAGMLFDTLHAKLLTLPDETEIFPGHQAGSVCGAGISGKPSSTIGFEKRFNSGLHISNKDEFVRYLTSEIPPRPAAMDKMVAANIAA